MMLFILLYVHTYLYKQHPKCPFPIGKMLIVDKMKMKHIYIYIYKNLRVFRV